MAGPQKGLPSGATTYLLNSRRPGLPILRAQGNSPARADIVVKVGVDRRYGVHVLRHHRSRRAADLARANGVAKSHGNAMAKLSMPTEAAAALRVSERMLLFCVASNTDWKHPAIPGEIVPTMVVKGLIDCNAGGALTLTDRGRALLRAMLPDL